MKTKIFITFLAILFSIATAKGQENLAIKFIDNSDVSVAIDDIQRITFDDNNLLLKTTDGNVNSYPIDDIAVITFIDETGIGELSSETVDVNFFVNGFGEIVVETPYQIRKLTVFDLSGREVARGSQSKLNVNFLNTGIYILQVTTDQGLVSKKFIKNR